MSTILEIKNIAVNYGNIKALKGVSLAINEGEIVCLIGANGAGKSTLLKAIVGLEPLLSGEVFFNQKQIARKQETGTDKKKERIMSEEDFIKEYAFSWNRKMFLRAFSSLKGYVTAQMKNMLNPPITTDKIVADGIALVPEGRGVFAGMTVLENLEMGAYLKKSKKYVAEKLDEVYSLFPILNERKDQKAGSLSGGEQQMLAIGRALMSSPKLLLLDEPGLGLAPLIIRDIFDAILKINREEQVTIFLVEQNAKLALSNSGRGYVMETGNVVMEDASPALLTNPKVKAAYLGE